jgi:hypothetical protein
MNGPQALLSGGYATDYLSFSQFLQNMGTMDAIQACHLRDVVKKTCRPQRVGKPFWHILLCLA